VIIMLMVRCSLRELWEKSDQAIDATHMVKEVPWGKEMLW